MSFTPPRAKSIRIGDDFVPWAEQKRIGQRAINADIHKFFHHLGPSAEEQVKLSKGGIRYWLNREGEVYGVDETNLALTSARGKMHDRRRQFWSRGRLHKQPKAMRVGRATIIGQMAAPTRNIKGYATWLGKRIGKAKHGWIKPAQALGVKGVPKWISGQTGSSGIFKQSGHAKWPAYIIGNNVPYIQQSGKELGIIRQALKWSTHALEKQLRETIRKNALRKR